MTAKVERRQSVNVGSVCTSSTAETKATYRAHPGGGREEPEEGDSPKGEVKSTGK
jgi:hypothetical protein